MGCEWGVHPTHTPKSGIYHVKSQRAHNKKTRVETVATPQRYLEAQYDVARAEFSYVWAYNGGE